jgi:hypothetical protein
VVGDLSGSSLLSFVGDVTGSTEAVARRPLALFTDVVDGGVVVSRWREERLGAITRTHLRHMPTSLWLMPTSGFKDAYKWFQGYETKGENVNITIKKREV